MNVVHLASSGELGGAEWVILDILQGLRVARPRLTAQLIVPAPGALSRRAVERGVEVRLVEWGTGLSRLGDALGNRQQIIRVIGRMILAIPELCAYVLRLRRALQALEPDIVHAHGFKMHLLAMWSRPRAVPVVLHLHDYIGRRPLMSRLLRSGLRGTVVGVAISHSIADDARRTALRTRAVRVAYNGIDIGEWSPEGARADLDALAGLLPPPRGTVRVGLISTMARWKGQEVFIRAISLLPSDGAVRAYIIGGSIYQSDRSQYDIEDLRRVAAEAGAEIGFTGLVADPAAAMRALDVVVHASTLPEPFGRVIVEAMALERAVVTTATGGAAELVDPGQTALVVPPGDAGALAGAIARLSSEPELRRRLGIAGRDRVRRLFERSVMTNTVLTVYDSLVQSGEIPAESHAG